MLGRLGDGVEEPSLPGQVSKAAPSHHRANRCRGGSTTWPVRYSTSISSRGSTEIEKPQDCKSHVSKTSTPTKPLLHSRVDASDVCKAPESGICPPPCTIPKKP